MREDRILWLVDRIYNTFGRPVPKQNSGQMQVLRDNLSEVPDECVKYIARKATDLDDMPRNLTKFCYGCWHEWQAETGEGGEYQCGTCDSFGGWTYFRKVEGNDGLEWHEFFSPCPVCTYIIPRLRKTVKPCCKYPWELERDGGVVMPNHYPGGVLQFKHDKGIDVQTKPEDVRAFARKWQDVKAKLVQRATA